MISGSGLRDDIMISDSTRLLSQSLRSSFNAAFQIPLDHEECQGMYSYSNLRPTDQDGD